MALAGLIVLLFHRVLLGGEIFFERDISWWWWGQAEVFVRALAAGRWPLWDPTMGFGQPLLANPNMQFFYPWTWLHLLLQPELCYTVYVVSHWVIAGAGMYALARHLCVSRRGSVLGSGVWLLSGPLLSTVNLWHHQAGAALLPAVLWSADRLLQAPSLRRGLALASLFAFQVLAASADMCAMGAILIAAVAAWRLSIHVEGRRARLLALAASLALGTGLSAAQWMPTIDITRGTERTALPAEIRTYWSVQPALLPQLLVPALVHRLPLSPAARETLFEPGRQPFFASLYLGLCAFPFVCLALLEPRPEHLGLARLTGVLLVSSTAVALGRHFIAYQALIAALPPLQIFRYPVKVTILTALAWALLSGIGWTAWEAGAQRRFVRRAVLGLTLPWVGISVAGAVFAFVPNGWVTAWLEAGDAVGPLRRALAVQLLLTAGLTMVAALAVAKRPGWLFPGRRAFALVLLVWADGYLVHEGLNPTIAKGTFARPPSTVDLVRGWTLPRLYTFSYKTIAGKTYRHRPSDEAVAAIPAPLHDPLQTARVDQNSGPALRRWGIAGSFEPDGVGLEAPYVRSLGMFFQAQEETPGFLRLLRMAAVQAVLARHSDGLEDLPLLGTSDDGRPQPLRVLGVPAPFARAYAVGTSRIVAGLAAYQTLVDPTFDPAQEVVLREGTPVRASGAFRSRTTIESYEADHVRLDVELNEPGFVVVADAFAEQWKATVDAAAAPLLRANVAFRAVPVAAGRHTVEMLYRPRAVVWGLWVSGGSMTALLALLLRTRRPHGAPDEAQGSIAEASA
jgi:hypothetical protein